MDFKGKFKELLTENLSETDLEKFVKKLIASFRSVKLTAVDGMAGFNLMVKDDPVAIVDVDGKDIDIIFLAYDKAINKHTADALVKAAEQLAAKLGAPYDKAEINSEWQDYDE